MECGMELRKSIAKRLFFKTEQRHQSNFLQNAPADEPIFKTVIAFIIGDFIGAGLIGLTLDFKATRYDFYRIASLFTGKNIE